MPAVVTAALVVLRLDGSGIDQARLERDATTACRLVDHRVDHDESGAPPTSTMFAAAVNATCVLYRGAGGGAGGGFVPLLSSPALDEALAIAQADQQRWAVA